MCMEPDTVKIFEQYLDTEEKLQQDFIDSKFLSRAGPPSLANIDGKLELKNGNIKLTELKGFDYEPITV